MKKLFIGILSIAIILILSACGSGLEDMESVDEDGYRKIVWEGRSYIPFCIVSKNDCGRKIGIVDGDKQEIVSVYKNYPEEEWIAIYLTVDGGAFLLKEESVTKIPDGLICEYE